VADVANIRFFHSFALSGGKNIVGTGKPLAVQQAEADYAFRHGVEGRSVLDIGAWDGYFSFEAEKRGAARVLVCRGDGVGKAGRARLLVAYSQEGGSQIDLDVIDHAPTAAARARWAKAKAAGKTLAHHA